MAWIPPSHTPYQWQNSPSLATPLNAADLITAENDLVSYTQQVGGLVGLGAIPIQSVNYTAAPSDFVPCDATSTSFTVTLPTTPVDQTRIGVKIVKIGATHTITVAAGTGDVFNVSGGPTTLTLSGLFQGVLLQYNAANQIWYTIADTPIGQALGGGTNLGFQSSQGPTIGQLLDLRLATSASPDLTVNPVVKVSRTVQLNASQVFGDGNENATAANFSALGTANNQVQIVGLLAQAQNTGTAGGTSSNGSNDRPDAAALYTVGKIEGSGIGHAFGIVPVAHADVPSGSGADAIQTFTYNDSGWDSFTAGVSQSAIRGMSIFQYGGNVGGVGIEIVGPNGQSGNQFDTGIHFSGYSSLQRTDTNCGVVSGLAIITDPSCIAWDQYSTVTGTGIPSNAVVASVSAPTSTTVNGTGQTLSTTPSTLNVASTAGYPTGGGILQVAVTNTTGAAGIMARVTYTGVSGNSFTGCTVPAGSYTATNNGTVQMYGAVAPTATTTTGSQTINTTPSTFTVGSTAGYPTSGGCLSVAGVTGTVYYTGVGSSTTFTGVTVASGSFTATASGAVTFLASFTMNVNATASNTESLTLARQGPTRTAIIQDDSDSAYGILFTSNSNHINGAIVVASGAGAVLIGETSANNTTSLLEAKAPNSAARPLIYWGNGSFTQNYSMEWQNSGGLFELFVAAANNNIITGTALGDGGVKIQTANRFFHIGGSLRTDANCTTNGTAVVTDASITAADVGRAVSGTNIAANSRIISVVAGTSFTMNQNASGSGTQSLSIGGNSVIKVGAGDTLGFFNVTAVAQQNAVGTATGYSAGATAATFHSDDTYTGNIGSTGYTINGIVAAMKNYGLLVL